MAECLESRTCHQQDVGSNPGSHAAECNPGQVVYTCSSVTKQYNLVLANGRGCLPAGEVIVGLEESTGSLWLTVTCGLTVKDQDQLWNPMLVSSMGLPFLGVSLVRQSV